MALTSLLLNEQLTEVIPAYKFITDPNRPEDPAVQQDYNQAAIQVPHVLSEQWHQGHAVPELTSSVVFCMQVYLCVCVGAYLCMLWGVCSWTYMVTTLAAPQCNTAMLLRAYLLCLYVVTRCQSSCAL